jgi:hypothetical protein
MATSPDLSVGTASLAVKAPEVRRTVVTRRAGVSTELESSVLIRAEKAAKEGDTRGALEIFKDPGKHIDKGTVTRAHEGRFGKDTIADATKVPPEFKSSKELDARKKDQQALLTNLAEVADKGFDKLPEPIRTDLGKKLADFLSQHEGFLTLKGWDPNTTPGKVALADYANSVLRDDKFKGDLKNVLASFVAGEPVDYSVLQEKLLEQDKLKAEELKLKGEIGDDKSGLKFDVADLEKQVAEFKSSVTKDANDNVVIEPGAMAQAKINFDGQKAGINGNIAAINKDMGTIKSILARGNGAMTPLMVNYMSDSGPSSQSFSTIPELRKFMEEQGGFAKVEALKAAWAAQIPAIDVKIKALDIHSKDLDTKLAEKQKSLNDKEAALKENQDKKAGVDAEITGEQAKVKAGEEAVNESIKDMLGEAVTDMWVREAEEIEGVKQEHISKTRKVAYEKATEKVRDSVYDKASKHFDRKKIGALAKDIIKDGPEAWGSAQVTALIAELRSKPSPENTEAVAYLTELKSNPDSLRDFSVEIAKDALALVAYKNPKALVAVFTADEALMRKTAGDILPDLIAGARTDSRYGEVATAVLGEKAVKMSKAELKDVVENMDKNILSKKLMTALISLGLLGTMIVKRAAKG